MVENFQSDSERLPLLGATGETPESTSKQPNNSDNLLNFSTQNLDGRSFTSCKVCGYQIDITDKTETFVVKCLKCNEATPIKRAPAKKRYVRCSCNCLLICYETANRIVCPRVNCKKIIELPIKKRRIEDDLSGGSYLPQNDDQLSHSPQPISDDFRVYVNCGHCNHRFMFSVLSNQLATCPSCRRKSSMGHSYANTRGVIFIVLFAIFVTIAINNSIKAKNDSIYLILSLVLYLISIIFLLRSCYYFTLKVSEISTNSFA